MDIDIEQPDDLMAYLRQCGHIVPNEAITAQVLAGGVSNRTVLVTRADQTQWVLKQALAKLRVKVDWFSDPLRIHREALALRELATLTPRSSVPRLVFDDADQHIIAMQAVPQPHSNWKVMLLQGALDLRHVRQFADWLGMVQSHAYKSATLKALFADRSFFETLRLEPYYRYTAHQVPQATAFFQHLIDDTLARQDTLVHGDFSPKNVLVYQDSLVVLDYEVIHWGDPAFDVGFAMTHLLSKAHHLAAHRVAFAQAAQLFWQTYAAHVDGLFGDLEQRAARHTLACLLARVDGRSPLEYLRAAERQRQREVVLALMSQPVSSMADVIDEFVRSLS